MEQSYFDDWEPIGGLEIGRHYDHAPIAQAILEFHVEPVPDIPLSTFEQIDFGPEFQHRQPVFRMSAEIQVGLGGVGGSSASTRQDAAGFMYLRDDEKRMIQALPTYYTYILHAPYDDWESFTAESESAWYAYKAATNPQGVQSIGARFVNFIPLPEKAIEIRDYLRIAIDIPAALPQELRNLFAQVDIPMKKYGATCILTTAIAEPSEDYPGGALVLDIDARTPVDILTSNEGFDEKIRDKLGVLRMVKNLAFEACITDATRERIR